MTRDAWDDGSTYESYVGRWSRVVAARFVEWLRVSPGSTWLDFGCGTGALSQTILARAGARLVIGCDRSPGYVAYARDHTRDERARFTTAELPDLPSIAGGFDAVVSGLVLNFLPAPLDAVATLMTRARAGGVVAAYVWDYAEGMQLMRRFWDAAVELDPAAGPLDEGTRFGLCAKEPLARIFDAARLRDVSVAAIDVPTVFRDFDDYWTPFLGGQGPAPGYAMSLAPDRRAQLRAAIQQRLPVAADGRIALTARAWAVRGTVA